MVLTRWKVRLSRPFNWAKTTMDQWSTPQCKLESVRYTPPCKIQCSNKWICDIYHLSSSSQAQLPPHQKGVELHCTFSSTPFTAWLGGVVAAPKTELTSCQIGGIGYPRTVCGNPRHNLPNIGWEDTCISVAQLLISYYFLFFMEIVMIPLPTGCPGSTRWPVYSCTSPPTLGQTPPPYTTLDYEGSTPRLELYVWEEFRWCMTLTWWCHLVVKPL